jgi:hypothetical protein
MLLVAGARASLPTHFDAGQTATPDAFNPGDGAAARGTMNEGVRTG